MVKHKNRFGVSVSNSINWKPNTITDNHVVLKPRNYKPDIKIDEYHFQLIKNYLFVGAAFVIREEQCTCDYSHYDKTLQSPPFPYINCSSTKARRGGFGQHNTPFGGGPSNSLCNVFSIGTLAIYTGIVRVEERSKTNLIRIPRHSFIIAGSRYLVTNLNYFIPIMTTID